MADTDEHVGNATRTAHAQPVGRLFRCAPDATVTVTAGKSATAAEAMRRMDIFTALVMKHHVALVSSEGPSMTLRGRPKRIAAFTAEHARLSALGVV